MGRKVLEEIYRELEQELEIPFSLRDCERALWALVQTSDIWEALRRANSPMKFLCTFWNKLLQRGLLEVKENKLELTQTGRELVAELGFSECPDFRCHYCAGRGLDFTTDLREAVRTFSQLAQNRPEALQQYDQGYVTEATTWGRTAFLWEQGDLAGKEIFVLGDDDLNSLAFALTRVPRRVVVIDIDERLIQFLQKCAKEHSLALEAHVHDLRQPLPEQWVKSFDVFFCDPTESLPGFQAFVERGLLSLKGVGCAGYFGLTHLESSLSKWAKIQKFLLEKGTVITHLREYFNHYVNWNYMESMRSWDWLPVQVLPEPKQVWYTSSLFRIEVLEQKELSNHPLEGNIFDDAEVATT